MFLFLFPEHGPLWASMEWCPRPLGGLLWFLADRTSQAGVAWQHRAIQRLLQGPATALADWGFYVIPKMADQKLTFSMADPGLYKFFRA